MERNEWDRQQEIVRSEISDLQAIARSNPAVLKSGFDKLRAKYPEHRQFIDIEELMVYDRLRRFEDVVQLARRILAEDPSNYKAGLRLARALGILKDFDESAMWFERLLSHESVWDNSKELEVLYAHYSKMLITARRWQEVVSVLRKALEILPWSISLKTKLAMAYKSLGQYSDALAILSGLPRNDPYVHMETAHVFINMGEAKRAREHLDAAKRLFMLWRSEDRRLRNQHERESIMARLKALGIALRAVEGDIRYAEEWYAENYSRTPSAKLVGVAIDRLRRLRKAASGVKD